MFRAAAFDLDGTLLDSLADLAGATNAALAASGFPEHPVNAYRYFVGSGLETLVRRALAPLTPEELAPGTFERLVEATGQNYAHDWGLHTRPYQGIPELLAELAHRNIPCFVVTNKPQAWTEVMLQHFFPDMHFATIQGASPDCPLKPNPEPALRAAARLHLKPADCAFIGDSNVDMLTALNAGMTSFGAVWGFRGETELRDAGAQVLLQSPLELLSAFSPLNC